MSFSMNFSKGKKKPSKQYGLIIPKSKQTASSSMVSNVFGSKEDLENEDVTEDVQVLASKSINQKVIEKKYQQALEEDPNVFDYDGLYDEMQSKKQQQKQAAAAATNTSKKESKYIQNLIQKAQIREIENERIREKKLLREREEEDQLYGDKEKFISASYKRKLQEMKKWDEEDARLEALEAAEDVTKKGNEAMAGFYANLLTKNIAMGGDVNVSKSAYTTGKANLSKEEDDHNKRQRTEPPGPAQASSTLPQLQPSKPTSPATAAAEVRLVVPEAATAVVTQEAVTDKVEAKKVVEKSKEETISAARARFLARKVAGAAAGTSAEP